MTSALRHAWSDPNRPSRLETLRVCWRCAIVKVTRHDGGDAAMPWVEFRRSGVKVETRATPACEPGNWDGE